MAAKKVRAKSAKKKAKGSAKKTTRGSAKKRGGSWGVVVNPNAKLSPYAKNAQRVFSGGVQRAFANMARLGVPATVMIDGKMIRAVPTRVGGRFVVREPAPDRSRGR